MMIVWMLILPLKMVFMLIADGGVHAAADEGTNIDANADVDADADADDDDDDDGADDGADADADAEILKNV